MLIELKYEVQSGVIGWILDTGGEAAFSKPSTTCGSFLSCAMVSPTPKVLELLHLEICIVWNAESESDASLFRTKKTQTVDVLQGAETKLQSRAWDWAGTRHPSQNYLGENSSNPILGRWFQCCGSSETPWIWYHCHFQALKSHS